MKLLHSLDVDATRIIKTLIFKADDELVVVLCRGDHEINDIKLKNALGATAVEFANEGDVTELLSCEVGSIGPVKLPVDLKVIADHCSCINRKWCMRSERRWIPFNKCQS